jgi:hypothetical protein
MWNFLKTFLVVAIIAGMKTLIIDSAKEEFTTLLLIA